ncbi:protein takeout-like isoform X2 [Lycorma delicatula]|uniref:protein takeout-like isoform X2 n=1 Tax=Lycorma delicatula TaxID=130591 RepID=UPI003F516009
MQILFYTLLKGSIFIIFIFNVIITFNLVDGQKKLRLPELDLPPLDPLHLHEILLQQEDERAVHIKLHMSHIELYGISKGTISSVNADWDNYKIKIDMNFKDLEMIGDYDVEGKIMVLPIFGKGKFNFTFVGGEGHMELLGKRVKKDGMMYMHLENINWDYRPDHLTILMENLFNGDKARSAHMNDFLNENAKEIFSELKDTTRQSFIDTFLEFSRIIFDRIPIDSIALP